MVLATNQITAIEAMQEASSIAGIDFIDKSFGIFRNDNDETSRYYQATLRITCESILQDYFDHLDGQFQDILYLAPTTQDSTGFWEYEILEKPIFRVIKLLNGNIPLIAVDNLLDLKKRTNTYLLQPFSIKTSTKYNELSMLYLSSAIFLTKPDGQLLPVRKSILQNDADIILLDRYLVIYKLASTLLKYKNADYALIEKEYSKRLLYLIEKGTENKGRIDLRAGFGYE